MKLINQLTNGKLGAKEIRDEKGNVTTPGKTGQQVYDEELKKLNDIITDASFDLQFKIKYQDKGIIYNELIIKQQLDRSFQSFLKDIDDYVQKLRNSIYQKYANKSTNTNEFANELRDIEQQIQSIDKELARLRREMNNAIPGTADYLDYLKKYNEFANQKALLISQLNAAQVTDVINNKTIKYLIHLPNNL